MFQLNVWSNWIYKYTGTSRQRKDNTDRLWPWASEWERKKWKINFVKINNWRWREWRERRIDGETNRKQTKCSNSSNNSAVVDDDNHNNNNRHTIIGDTSTSWAVKVLWLVLYSVYSCYNWQMVSHLHPISPAINSCPISSSLVLSHRPPTTTIYLRHHFFECSHCMDPFRVSMFFRSLFSIVNQSILPWNRWKTQRNK